MFISTNSQLSSTRLKALRHISNEFVAAFKYSYSNGHLLLRHINLLIINYWQRVRGYPHVPALLRAGDHVLMTLLTSVLCRAALRTDTVINDLLAARPSDKPS